MDAISAYSFASCGWNALQALLLIVGPQVVLTLLKPAETANLAASDVEQYLARSLGFTLLALGLVTVVLSGSVPVGPALDAPVLLLTTLYHGASAFYGWARYTSTGQTGYLLGFVGSALLAAFGTWCLLFGGEKARISRRTGADKRTSGFPFRNAEADRRKVR